jgi:hypothetical protein
MDIAGAVTDNTSANKLAWKLLQDKYPTKFFYGRTLVAQFINAF